MYNRILLIINELFHELLMPRVNNHLYKILIERDAIASVLLDDFKLEDIYIHKNCNCHINRHILKLIEKNKGACTLFHSRRTRNEFYLVHNKNVIKLILNSTEIYPCPSFEGQVQYNAFSWILSDNFEELNFILQRGRRIINGIRKYKNLNRDYHETYILQCNDNGYKTNEKIKLGQGKKHDNTCIGFTAPYAPHKDNIFMLGVHQILTDDSPENYKTNNFNAAGGKKDILIKNKIIVAEDTIDTAIRELYEETGLYIDKPLFLLGMQLSEILDIKGINIGVGNRFIVYNIFLPPLKYINITQDVSNPLTARLILTL